ncbi:MAG: hypothetical protein C4576_20180 [Desulfobacteraceae bacterium]|nr:MAG: hypothetical protein C4576_20180 [Desulfobacteraceae bacterium]
MNISCPNPDCRVAETGKCVEGFNVEECPHQKSAVAEPESPDQHASSDASGTQERPSDFFVASGNILTIAEATNVLRSGTTRVITIIGPSKSGKTTFGVSLYDAFQNGTFDRWSFGGSLTLPAFEKRCHLARAESGKSSPDTQRTPLSDGLGFLHLAIYSNETRRVNLLISDRSGEFYTAVADSQEDIKKVYEVARADYVLFLLDGEKLASDERHGVKSDLMIVLETFVEGGILGKYHRVGIALTKYDLVLNSGLRERVENDFNRLLESIRKRYASALLEINATKIAARPTNNLVEPRFGVLNVLEDCMRQRACKDFVTPARLQVDRWFHRLSIIDGGAQ